MIELDGDSLVASIRGMHDKYPTCGQQRNLLMSLPDDQLLYLARLLRGEPSVPPALSGEQWQRMVEAIRPNWVLPLIYWQAARLPPGSRPPSEVMLALKTAYLRSKGDSVRVEFQLRELLAALEEAGIRSLVLKGPALATLVYPDPGLRPGSDIDLLIRPDDMPKVRQALEGIGYVCQEKCYDISKKLYNEEKFLCPARPHYVMVEVHWNLHVYCDMSVDGLFERAVAVPLPGPRFEALCPVDALVFNALHMLMHHREDVRLSWIYDAMLLARQITSPADWETLQQRSVEFGARTAVEVSLRLAGLWAGLAVPAPFDDFSRWPQPREIENIALTHSVLGTSDRMVDRFRFMWYCSHGTLAKAKLILYVLFPPFEMMRNAYPGSSDWLIPVNYVRRLLKLSARVIASRGDAMVSRR